MRRDTSNLEASTTVQDGKNPLTLAKGDDSVDSMKGAELSSSLTGDSRVFNDVWYRHFLKPITSCRNRAVPYNESFKRRILRPVGIPVAQFAGFHAMFNAPHRHYSPLIGLLFTYNNFIDNLYRYGDPDEPAVELIKSLFHVLPGGEVQATHLGSCAGAHLSPSIIGELFEALERLKPKLTEKRDAEGKILLGDELLHLIFNHPDYQESRKHLCETLKAAESDLEALRKQDADSKHVRQKIKALEGDVIKIRRHKIKRAESALKTASDTDRRDRLVAEITAQQSALEEAKKEIDELRCHIVTSLDFKIARKALRRAQEMFDLEKDSRTQLARTLASCFWLYDLDTLQRSEILPAFTTSTILLAYVWRKYDSIRYLKGYMESMARLGALNVSCSTVTALLDERASMSVSFAVDASKDIQLPRTRKHWSAEDKALAAAIVIRKPGIARRPHIVHFSYVSWADYSKFPDCGETALRNLLNQMLYNPATGQFDHELLAELRDRHYPLLSQKLIGFYAQHPNPQDVSDHSVCRSWLEVVSNLNHGRENGLKVRYRREKQQENIASPLSNIMRVVNALFGVEPLNKDRLEEVVRRINELRGWKLTVDTSAIKKDGFGIVSITDGKVRYELQSYKPVHFGFVQAETLALDASGRHDYAVFRRLMSYCCGPPCTKDGDPVFLEQLAIASLFVPYAFQRKKLGGFFDSCPAHYRMLFTELFKSSQKGAVLRWARSHHPKDPHVAGFSNRIWNYTEPAFLPNPQASSPTESVSSHSLHS